VKKIVLRILFTLLLAVVALVAVACLFPHQILTLDSGPAKADVIVVLGGGWQERPLRAAELFKEHDAPKIIVTGAGDDQINRLCLIHAGVPDSAIEVESKSTTTRENAEFTIKLLRAENLHSAILVTTWYHSRRALKTFQHFAPDLKFYSCPSYVNSRRKDLPWVINKEFAKLPGYWICYGVWPF
jgi:uncharacterized SAM-binding protein YcdF (DUF218 family)